MDVHEVTNAEYAACVSGGGCTPPGSFSSLTCGVYYGNTTYADFPVIYVDWNQATAYCAWASKRLPTEAQWEYAARGGLDGKYFSWGNTVDGAYANFANSGDPWDNDTSPVEYYPPNGYGLYDMAGNITEWVNDWYSSSYYQYCIDNEIFYEPPGPASGTLRVVRGGDFFIDSYLVSDRIFSLDPNNSNGRYGFRCVRD
jgi:eukaryotic-like serine/threonine-protein kinase